MIKKTALKQKSGVTLVEVLIYTVLLVFVLGLTVNFLYQVANFKLLAKSKSSLFQNSAFAVEKIVKDIRSCQGVIFPVDENFSSSLILQTSEGQVAYQVVDGVLQRNSTALTDNSVIVSLEPPNKGFRKISQTIQLKIGFKAKIKPFGQNRKEEIYQTTVFFNQ